MTKQHMYIFLSFVHVFESLTRYNNDFFSFIITCKQDPIVVYLKHEFIVNWISNCKWWKYIIFVKLDISKWSI